MSHRPMLPWSHVGDEYFLVVLTRGCVELFVTAARPTLC